MRKSQSVHTTLEKFENGVYILKTRQMFYVHATPQKFENATITGHFNLCLEKIWTGKSQDFRDIMVFEKLCFQNVFRPH